MYVVQLNFATQRAVTKVGSVARGGLDVGPHHPLMLERMYVVAESRGLSVRDTGCRLDGKE